MEALAAAMFIAGFKEVGKLYLSKFNWGPTFIRLNQELLNGYAKCKDGKEIVAFQNQYLDHLGKLTLFKIKLFIYYSQIVQLLTWMF